MISHALIVGLVWIGAMVLIVRFFIGSRPPERRRDEHDPESP